MAQSSAPRRGRRRLSLSVRLTLLVLFAALLPVAAVVGINDYLARGTLVKQGQQALSTDAKAKAQLVDTYLHERFQDGGALAALSTTPGFLLCTEAPQLPAAQAQAIEIAANCADPAFGASFYAGSVCRGLAVGVVRDTNYVAWSIFTPTGIPLLNATPATATLFAHAPTTLSAAPCQSSKASAIPQEDLKLIAQQSQQGLQALSPVWFNPTAGHAYINLYTPVCVTPGVGEGQCAPNQKGQQVVGIMRATLQMDSAQAGATSIWSIVNGDTTNGAGSSAFIADSSGVIIADPNPALRFTAVQTLDADTVHLISSEQRYGTSTAPQEENLPDIASAINGNGGEVAFQGIASPGSTVQYEFVREKLANAPWSYFVLSPLSTVTAVADNQLRTSLEIAGVIALLAILIGLLFGRTTASPVRASAAELEHAATALKALSDRQESSASEQMWVVEACKTGMETVRFLSDAMNQAARRVLDASNWFDQYWDRLTEDQARRTVQHLRELAHYINQAAAKQQTNNESLDKAIGVTMQVTDQLAAGASEAAASADQLEQVVADLQRVVGGHPHITPATDEEMAPAAELPSPMVPQPGTAPYGQDPAYGGYGGYGNGGYGNGGYGNGGRAPAPPNPPSQWGALPNPPSMWGGDYAPANPRGGYGQVQSSPRHGGQAPGNERSRW